MLTNNDINYLETNMSHFKTSFFQLVSDFGPDYQGNFMLTLADIKRNTGRERLTEVTLSQYEQYLRSHGFNVERTNMGISLFLSARSVVPIGNEAIELSNALKLFRDRALMKGDMDNF